MSGFSTQTTEHLIRSDIWSRQLKDYFEESTAAMKYVNWLTEFPDGDTFHIPSIGQGQVMDYEEGQAVRYTAMATGDWTFSITEYKSSATYITDKMKQDSYYTNQLVSSFVPKMNRALQVVMETDVLNIGVSGQTPSNLNTINGAEHRWVGHGLNDTIALQDFALAEYALRKAHVPMSNLVAIVDPSTALTLATQTNLVNVSNNPLWHGIIEEPIETGMKFVRNVYGFDVYTSSFLPTVASETIDGNTVTNGVANIFFSAAGGDTSPFKGAVRQAPRVESERNKDLQRDEYVLTTRYGFGFYRPENFVTVLTSPSAALALAKA